MLEQSVNLEELDIGSQTQIKIEQQVAQKAFLNLKTRKGSIKVLAAPTDEVLFETATKRTKLAQILQG